MKYLTLTLLIITSIYVKAQVESRVYYADENLVPRERQVDFTHLRLEVDFVPEEGKVNGKVKHYFTVLRKTVDTIYLDGPNINFEAVELDGKVVEFKTTEDGIIIYSSQSMTWESKHELLITYHAFPKKGLYFIGWDDPNGLSRKQIWTQGQGLDNRYWIPMYDSPNDKVTSEVIATANSEFKVLSNGKNVGTKTNKDGTTTWHYVLKHPHPSYLIMLGIGKYAIKTSKSISDVPMHFYYYPEWEERVESTYRFSEDMMNFMEEETGTPYPWVSYSQIPVQDFMYGAMENTTATIFGDFYFTDEKGFDDRNYVRVNAHELAHQWFGNMVSARTSSHQWLQESFATHYDLTYQGIAFGKDHFNWERRKAQEQALKASVTDYKPVAHSSSGTVRHYPKGAHVLQMLKYVVGKDQFNKAIKYYLKKHAYSNVDSEDLLIAFHESLGYSLDWFWEEWIYHGGEPFYDVKYTEAIINEKSYSMFDVTQVHPRNELVGLFDMPIKIEVHFKDGSKVDKTVRINKAHQQVKIETPSRKKVAYYLFDPNSEVMKKCEFEKPFEVLIEQAKKASNMIDRFDAVEALGGMNITDEEDLNKLNELYTHILKSEAFYAVKEAIVKQVSNQPEKEELLKIALKDRDKMVKQALLNYNFFVSPTLLPYYEAYLDDDSYEIVELTLRKLCKLFPENASKYLSLTNGIEGVFAKNVRITWLEIAYDREEDEAFINELVNYTSPSSEFRTRVNAAEALKRLNYLNETAIENLFQATFSFNSRLRNPVYAVLEYFYDQNEYRRMIFDKARSASYTADERKRLRRFYAF